ncbi:hypothetical protein QJS10_CPB13g00224 [Acorus calamus]|uniref:Uncharacterized protein n=1 Tax=Acorus calamus TaxID=4465 RepID=A0AAV9DKP0_ACOCL|nr:hypothetical protein QJS10_CPB13g00224 [Acorus calamus]
MVSSTFNEVLKPLFTAKLVRLKQAKDEAEKEVAEHLCPYGSRIPEKSSRDQWGLRFECQAP